MSIQKYIEQFYKNQDEVVIHVTIYNPTYPEAEKDVWYITQISDHHDLEYITNFYSIRSIFPTAVLKFWVMTTPQEVGKDRIYFGNMQHWRFYFLVRDTSYRVFHDFCFDDIRDVTLCKKFDESQIYHYETKHILCLNRIECSEVNIVYVACPIEYDVGMLHLENEEENFVVSLNCIHEEEHKYNPPFEIQYEDDTYRKVILPQSNVRCTSNLIIISPYKILMYANKLIM